MLKAIIVLIFFFVVTAYAKAAPVFWNAANEGLVSSPVRLQTFDESVNFQPGINLYQASAELTDLFGSNGNQLCAPNAITHAVNFLKHHRNPPFSRLASFPDMDRDGDPDTYKDQIRYFFQSCSTDREIGTRVHQAIDCMDNYVKASGYSSFTFMIGAHSKSELPGHPNDQLKRAVRTTDIRYYLGQQAGLIMTVGWYRFNKDSQTYVRESGHFFNLYGYDYNEIWGNERINLKVVNSWINYQGRTADLMFDDVSMTRVTGPSFYYPTNIEFELAGPGFTFTEHKALVEDIFIIYPY